MKSFSAVVGKKFLRKVLGPEVNTIYEVNPQNGTSFEVNPEKIPPEENLERNQEKLLSSASRILRAIFDSVDDSPL